jgi:hypothetical protein
VTPRERRVPISEESTRHPSGVVGMAGVKLSVEGGQEVEKLRKATAAIVDGKESSEGAFEIDRPIEVDGKKPVVRIETASDGEQAGEMKLTLVLRGSKKVDDVREKIEDGLAEILFEVAQ